MRKNKVNTEETKPTWIVYGTGEKLEDPDFIDYYRLHKLDEVLAYKLLGSFTEEGKYELSPEIRPTLVGVKKLLTATDFGEFVAESELGCITLHFKAKFWHEDNKGFANLYLIEHVDEDEIVTFVAQYYADYDDVFTQKLRVAFNILDDVDDYSDEIAEKIKQYVEQQDLKRIEREFVVELQSEYYLLEMMEVLAKGGEKSKRILEKIKEAHETSKSLPNQSTTYTQLRRKLDILIMQEGGFKELKKELPEELPKTIRVFTKPVMEYDQVSEKLQTMTTSKAQTTPSADGKKKAPKSSARKLPKPGPLYKYKTEKPKPKAKESKKKDLMLGADINKEITAQAPIKVVPVIEPVLPASTEAVENFDAQNFDEIETVARSESTASEASAAPSSATPTAATPTTVTPIVEPATETSYKIQDSLFSSMADSILNGKTVEPGRGSGGATIKPPDSPSPPPVNIGGEVPKPTHIDPSSYK